MKPTVGRIVFYKVCFPNEPPAYYPLLVTEVDDTTVGGWCFGEATLGFHRGVEEGDGEAEWSWPPRV
jgi:hypothetical protein